MPDQTYFLGIDVGTTGRNVLLIAMSRVASAGGGAIPPETGTIRVGSYERRSRG